MGTFSNNNYVPNIGQYTRPELVTSPFVSPVVGPQGASGFTQGNFTFAVPTQASQMTSVMSQSVLPGSLYSSHMPMGLAPGVGAAWQHTVPPGVRTSWQHTIPNQMPWGEMPQSCMGAGGVTTFTGLPNFVFSPTISSSAIITPRPSCSSSYKRNKRRHTEDIEGSAPEHKIFLTEERMAHEMRNLTLDNQKASGRNMPDLIPSDDGKPLRCDTFSDGYTRLKEIEDRLEEDLEEEEEDDDNQSRNLEGKIVIHDSIAKEILSQDSILPKKILQDLNKPCLQVVLWKPPGGFVKNPVEDPDLLSTTKDNSATQDIMDNQINVQSIQKILPPWSTSGYMETEEEMSGSLDNEML